MGKRIIEEHDEGFRVSFTYSPLLVSKVKFALPRRPRWDGEGWVFKSEISDLDSLEILIKQDGFVPTFGARDKLRNARSALLRRGDMSNSHESDFEPAIKGLYPYQKAGVEYITQRRRVIVGDGLGLGKTVQTLASLETLGHFPALVVCPASVKDTWRKEVEKWVPHRTVSVVSGGKLKDGDYDADIVVVNYDILKPREESLVGHGWEAIVYDEVHMLKNHKTKRSRAAKNITRNTNTVIGLSGTLTPNRLPELINPLILIGRLDDLGGYDSLRAQHMRYERRPWGMTYVGAKNVEELHRKLRQTCYLRRTKDNIGMEMPKKTRSFLTVPISNRSEYRKAEKEFKQWVLENRSELEAEATLRAEALVKLGVLRRIGGAGKVKAVREWLEAASEDGPVVVFCAHKATAEAIHAEFPDTSIVITGEVPTHRRPYLVEEFTSGRKQVLIATAACMGTGVDGLQNVASTAAFVELEWTPALHEQAEGRLARMGQKNPVSIYYFIGEGTVDVRVQKMLEMKRLETEKIIDGAASDESFASDLLSQWD